MKYTVLFFIAMLLAGVGYGQSPADADWGDDFKNPPAALRPMPFWHLNGTLTTAEIKAQLRDSRDQSGFGGVAVLPVDKTRPAYLSDDYFARYADILKTARELGMEVILYDDTGFPSGSAGGELQQLFPDDTMKRLDMAEADVQGPVVCSRALPAGVLMGVVAMNAQTGQRLDITASVSKGKLTWKAPEGAWKIMFFTCVKSGNRLVDYLSAESVDQFIPLTYGEYFKRFPEYFGTTIRRDFFDDVGFYAQTRPWTPAFNEKFQKKFGVSPVPLYPALWSDIGPDTAAARVALFGFRADLLAEGYPARVSAWCRAHGIQSEGHPPGNYDPCPVDMHCDTFKFYRHVDIPLMDAIFYHGHGRPGFKLVSSAATMYDRPLVAAEEYGAFAEDRFDSTMLYRTGMELFARGVNRVVPHGMWLDPQHVEIPPLISHFSAKLRPALPGYNQWAARSSLLLQGGRPVVDIAMLYPIASLEAYYNFNLPDSKRWGQYVPPEADYQRLSDRLTCQVRRDFTFLHPDALAAQCTRHGATLRLDNATNWQDYQVLIIPGGKVIPWASLKEIKDFYDHGGRVVATTCRPQKSAEFGHDADVQTAVTEMFSPVPSSAPAPRLHIGIQVAGTTIKTFVDGQLVDTRSDATFKQGGIGFREADQESATFANVKVTTPAGGILLSDAFRRNLDQWRNVANTALHDGELTVSENQSLRSREGADWSDYTFETDLVIQEGVAGFVFRAVDEDNYYMWQFNPAARQLQPHVKINGRWQVMPVVPLPGVDYVATSFQVRTNRHGGKAYYAPQPTAGTLQAILDDALPVPDVAFDPNLRVSSGNGALSYLHKQKDGREIYYFANSSNDAVDTFVRLRGHLTPQLWNPQNGDKAVAEVSYLVEHGQAITRLHLQLAPVTSLFAVAPSTAATGRAE
jgi:putative intracellular protease/amidase